MRKIKLDDEAYSNVNIIGMSTSLKDYQLSLFINKFLKKKLKKKNDFLYSNKPNQTTVNYSFYYYNDQDNLKHYYLISNKSNNLLLINSLKNIDFLLFIKSEISKPKIQSIIEGIRTIKNVFFVFNVDNSKIKNLTLLINSIDYHIELNSQYENKTELD